MVDLDPVTWRNLGHFFEPRRYIAAAQSGEHGLFVLHDAGRTLKVVDTATERRPEGIPAQIDDAAGLARELYARGEWQRVHVIDRRHLASVARQAQATPQRDLASDGYYHLVYTLMWGDPQGYACEPLRLATFHGWTYADAERFVAQLPSPATVALGVYAGDALTIGLILVVEDGLIRRATTFESLKQQPATTGPTQQTLLALCNALDAQYAAPAAVLLCDDATFAGWLDASDKSAYLNDAQANGAAIWHIADAP